MGRCCERHLFESWPFECRRLDGGLLLMVWMCLLLLQQLLLLLLMLQNTQKQRRRKQENNRHEREYATRLKADVSARRNGSSRSGRLTVNRPMGQKPSVCRSCTRTGYLHTLRMRLQTCSRCC